MSLLSETVIMASNSAMRRIKGCERGQRAMQAGLKCDRVPEMLGEWWLPSLYGQWFNRKKALIAMGYTDMSNATRG
jgi:hypothetical protein